MDSYETNFTIEKRKVQNDEILMIKFIKIIDDDLMEEMLNITNDENFYNEEYTVTTDYLFQHLNTLKARAEHKFNLIALVCYLNDVYKEKLDQFDKMNKNGKITFEHLHSIFTIGKEFVATVNGELVGSQVHDTKETIGMFGEKYFNVTGLFIISNGKEFIHTQKTFSINEFKGLKNVNDLEVKLMTDEYKKILIDRGQIFKKYGLETKYASYEGDMFRMSQYGPIKFNAEGRVMVDEIGFKTLNPNYGRDYNYENNKCNNDLPEHILYITWPFVRGFSFSAKQWGEIYVSKLKDIKFDDQAFNYLVMEEEKKEIIKALITYSDNTFKDIISGKSGGCIFLLHGLPGTGKTLTSESIAEYLHRPLYSITVGELGTTPDILEQKLTKILDIANKWNAVVLIDEADVFLEKRMENDILRNAMVGIFLRLLERYQGIMFLTTNRANSLDDAFRSRISVIFEYTKLSENDRHKIWNNLLEAADIYMKNEHINILSKQDINGRQIKNVIRLAQSLAKSKNELHFDKLINKFMINIDIFLTIFKHM